MYLNAVVEWKKYVFPSWEGGGALVQVKMSRNKPSKLETRQFRNYILANNSKNAAILMNFSIFEL